jgi:putative oxidoreductase
MKRISPAMVDIAYALFRFVFGALFMIHGAQKLFGWPNPERPPVTLATLAGAAGVIEFVGGALIAVGLLTTIAAFLSSGTMAVAYFMAHAEGGFFPSINGGEPAVMYCFAFLFIAAMGGGRFSVDGARRKGR